MKTDPMTPIPPGERIELLDALRGFALLWARPAGGAG
jgi:uncharacterized membrane protein YeiB